MIVITLQANVVTGSGNRRLVEGPKTGFTIPAHPTVPSRKYVALRDQVSRMSSLKLSNAALVTAIGWLLSAGALLGSFAFISVWLEVREFGGRYPALIVYFLMFVILALGASVTYYGVRVEHNRIMLLFPISAAVIMVYMYGFLACAPWVPCLVP